MAIKQDKNKQKSLPIEFLLLSGAHKKSVKSSDPEINRSPPFATAISYRFLASANTLSTIKKSY